MCKRNSTGLKLSLSENPSQNWASRTSRHNDLIYGIPCIRSHVASSSTVISLYDIVYPWKCVCMSSSRAPVATEDFLLFLQFWKVFYNANSLQLSFMDLLWYLAWWTCSGAFLSAKSFNSNRHLTLWRKLTVKNFLLIYIYYISGVIDGFWCQFSLGRDY